LKDYRIGTLEVWFVQWKQGTRVCVQMAVKCMCSGAFSLFKLYNIGQRNHDKCRNVKQHSIGLCGPKSMLISWITNTYK